MHLYRVYGLNLASDRSLDRLRPGTGSPDLTLFSVGAGSTALPPDTVDPAYVSPYRNAEGDTILRLYRRDADDLLRFTDVADFAVGPSTITCEPLDPRHDHRVDIYLLGTVLAFCLERSGVPALHASAVSLEGRAVAFLSDTGAGKSALASAFMCAGDPLLTDDILAIDRRDDRYMGRPGYAQVRLWPDQARHVLGHYEDLERVEPDGEKRVVGVGPDGFGAFDDCARPISCAYIPERQPEGLASEVTIASAGPAEAVMALIRNSFTARIIHTLGWAPARLRYFSDFVRAVPVRRLIYPSGFEHLPRVRDAVCQDLRRLEA